MSWSNPGAIIEHTIRATQLREHLLSVSPSGTLLDLGCGPRPYFDLYAPYFQKTIGADLADSPFPKKGVDIYCKATAVPLDDSSIDFILCTEVLHDIPEPDEFFLEVYRLLKPGGTLFLTSPFVVPLVDGAFDHYRYTRHGLEYRIKKANLTPTSIQPVGDIFSVCITLGIKPVLKVFSTLSKQLRFKGLYSAYNPLLFLLVIVPQLMYLACRNLPVLKALLKRFDYGPIGYVSIVTKST
ncbi:MAG: class I SAM-dependent methyltransferase [Bacteroidia bacterium]|nr:class I SAM-dependent methyltransferase [Bacteroidia bacterium]